MNVPASSVVTTTSTDPISTALTGAPPTHAASHWPACRPHRDASPPQPACAAHQPKPPSPHGRYPTQPVSASAYGTATSGAHRPGSAQRFREFLHQRHQVLLLRIPAALLRLGCLTPQVGHLLLLGSDRVDGLGGDEPAFQQRGDDHGGECNGSAPGSRCYDCCPHRCPRPRLLDQDSRRPASRSATRLAMSSLSASDSGAAGAAVVGSAAIFAASASTLPVSASTPAAAARAFACASITTVPKDIVG